MFKRLKSSILNLQQLDETSKKKWLIGLTAAATILVIFLWASYLNATVASVDSNQNQPEVSNWEVFKTSLQVLGSKVETGLAGSYVYFDHQLTAGKTFTINK
jgi:hypothetical protein